MKLSTCPNGHFYDGDKYASCPYCTPTAKENENKVTEALYTEVQKPTAPVGGVRSATAPQAEPKPLKFTPQAEADPQPAPVQQEKNEQTAKAQPVSQPGPAAAPTQAINTAAADWEEEGENCTVGYYSQVLGIEPVVGWLVCIKGAYRGQSFKLKSGRNFIGRASNMDIVLAADQSVSRLRHAAVIYDPRSRSFIVAAGDARELCYLNGTLVVTSNLLKIHDVLSCGNTDLMLIPLCDEHFSWEDGMAETQEES